MFIMVTEYESDRFILSLLTLVKLLSVQGNKNLLIIWWYKSDNIHTAFLNMVQV